MPTTITLENATKLVAQAHLNIEKIMFKSEHIAQILNKNLEHVEGTPSVPAEAPENIKLLNWLANESEACLNLANGIFLLLITVENMIREPREVTPSE